MQLSLRQQLAQFAHLLQMQLFPILEQASGELDETAKRFVTTLEMIPLARFVPCGEGGMGRPRKNRYALACAFVAKAVYGLALTRQLLQRLRQDGTLRRLCGWNTVAQLPGESTFSRAFAEFAQMELPQLVHAALIADTQKHRLIGHIARDSTAIEAREHFPERPTQSTAEKPPVPARKMGAPKGPHKRYKGGKRPYQPPSDTRMRRQRSMTLPEMLAELPRHCSLGVKTADGGNQQYWRGYKLHLDVADGQIPISAILTAASLHDSQVAIPLATMTAQRVTNCYDIMDAAYDATEIMEHSRSLGHVPIIRPVKRMRKIAFQGEQPSRQFSWAEEDRFRERTMVERVNARLKDEFGGRQIRLRGASKIMAHLMFGVLALTVDQLLKLAC